VNAVVADDGIVGLLENVRSGHRLTWSSDMKKSTVDADHAKKLEDMMTVRFKAVFDSLDRLKEQWDRATREIQRTNAADVRVTRLVLRDHNQRIKALERKR
jgi:hypothetical protein